MRAFFIDTDAGTIEQIDIDRGRFLETLYERIDCQLVDIIAREPIPGHDIWIDEEGLLYDTPPPWPANDPRHISKNLRRPRHRDRRTGRRRRDDRSDMHRRRHSGARLCCFGAFRARRLVRAAPHRPDHRRLKANGQDQTPARPPNL